MAHNDAEDIYTKRSNFKTILCNKTKTQQLLFAQ